jgi:hypothetical protein
MFFKINILLFLGLVNSFIFPQFYRNIREPITQLSLSKYPRKEQSHYPLSRIYHEQYMNRLRSNNFTGNENNKNNKVRKIKRDREFKRNYYQEDDDDDFEMDDEEIALFEKLLKQEEDEDEENNNGLPPGVFVSILIKICLIRILIIQDLMKMVKKEIYGVNRSDLHYLIEIGNQRTLKLLQNHPLISLV